MPSQTMPSDTGAGGFVSLKRIALLANCDRSVISRLLAAGKIAPAAVVTAGSLNSHPVFTEHQAEAVRSILATERAAKSSSK